uniref:protein regulator of cytokinesis 1-like isoform X1 n=1 Tax=Styela clava TaxID=7725 RepID=UPI00193A3EDB|nr:protein regulator of cytokinesis 1-like isoform X1 [Styela clava]XP_039274565.1 protein regulator of cytokinesis 1-like isoform X1 [Styela clava]
MEETKREINCILNRNMVILEDIWKRLGIPENKVQDRRCDCVNHLRFLVENMVKEESATEKRISDNIRANEQISEILQEKLGTLSEQEEILIKQAPSGAMSETILVKNKRLEDTIKVLEKLKVKRIQKTTQLIDECRNLSREVSSIPHELTFVKFGDRIPTILEIDNLLNSSNDLKKEKDKRLQEFGEIRPRVAKWMTELGISPDDTFEINLLVEPDDAFIVTNENMDRLRQLEKNTKNSRDEREKEILDIKSKVTQMWDLMEISVEERVKIENEANGLKQKNLAILYAELDKLKELRRDSLQNLTEKTLNELHNIRRQARLLAPDLEIFVNQPVSEESLDLITNTLEETKILLQSRQPILEKVYSWRDTVNELKAFAIKAKDPSRLRNRGGNLLNEEKKRKLLEKSLPKITAAMMKDIAMWEENNGEFLIDGITVDEFRKGVTEEKENEQTQEQQKKKRKLETEMKYGSSNPHRAKKSRTDIKIILSKDDDDTATSSQNGSTLGEVKLTAWGSMRYSPNKPPVAPKTTTSKDSKVKKMTKVGVAIKQYTSKVLKTNISCRKSSATTDNLLEPSTSGTFANRKMRRRSKSLSCMVQDNAAQHSKLSAYKPGSRLPLPSATNPSKMFTPKRRHESTRIATGGFQISSRAEQSTLSMLSETIESRPSCMDQSVSARFSTVSQHDFDRELLGDRPRNARSSIIPSRKVR